MGVHYVATYKHKCPEYKKNNATIKQNPFIHLIDLEFRLKESSKEGLGQRWGHWLFRVWKTELTHARILAIALNVYTSLEQVLVDPEIDNYTKVGTVFNSFNGYSWLYIHIHIHILNRSTVQNFVDILWRNPP